MKVEDKEIKEITFAQERELYNTYKRAYVTKDGKVEIDWDSHDKAIAMALEFALDNPEEVLKNMSHPEIDKFAQDILLQYLRVNDEKKP
tara:strand:- start:1197 stop:1463 length:267 start_codon:yes stop_codon:yes gene_type:complete